MQLLNISNFSNFYYYQIRFSGQVSTAANCVTCFYGRAAGAGAKRYTFFYVKVFEKQAEAACRKEVSGFSCVSL
jgi:hypothetical protein